MLSYDLFVHSSSRIAKAVSRVAFVAFAAALALMYSVGLATSSLKAETARESSDPAESVWVISTRCAPFCGHHMAREAVLDYCRMTRDEDGCIDWLQSDRETFNSSNELAVPTCFYVHGNRMSHCQAINEGLQVLDCLRCQAEGRKFRLVIWSWPSLKIQGGNRKDVRVKAARSDLQGFYLARCLHRMNPDAKVGLIGYSFGARVIAGALEMLAGGHVAGYCLDATDSDAAESDELPESDESTDPESLQSDDRSTLVESPRLRVVLVASATDRCWFLPGCRNGSALDMVDWALITCNPCDPVLKHYPKIYGCGGPQAAGYMGPALTCQQHEKTEVLNLSRSVGKSHKWNSYLYSPCLYWRLGDCVFDD